LSTANDVTPVHTNFVTGLDVDDLGGYRRLVAGLASKAAVIDILNRIIACSSPYTDGQTVILSVDTNTLGDGVGGRQCWQERSSDGEELHGERSNEGCVVE
jgi:hypothetical protein